jgi:hypothetical protein
VSLVKASLRIISISLSILAFALLFHNLLSLASTKIYTHEVLIGEIRYLFILVLIVVIAEVTYYGSKLDSLEYVRSIRGSLIIVYFYIIVSILICSSISPTFLDLLSDFIPPYPALYLFILITLLTAAILTREKYLESGEKVTFITGVVFEFVGISVGLVILYIITATFTGSHLPAGVATITAFIIYAWSRIENTIIKIHGSYTYGAFYSTIYRRATTATLCIILAWLTLYYNGLYLSKGLNYSWTFKNIEEAFLLLIYTSLAIVIVAGIIGIGGAIVFLLSEHGLRGLKLMAHHKLITGGRMEELLSSLSITQPSLKPIIQPMQPQSTAPVVSQNAQLATGSGVVKKCSYCGREVPLEANFCPYCGALLEGDEGTRIYTAPTKEKQETQVESSKGG